MKNIKIGNADYIVEFATCASMHKELTDIIVKELKEATDGKSIADVLKESKDVTQVTLHMLHAGLLEHQNNWDMSKTKAVMKQCLKERKGAENGSYKALRDELLEVMEEDKFFVLIG